MVTGYKRRDLAPVVDDHDRRVRELQQDLLQLHSGLEQHADDDTRYEDALRDVWDATTQLLEYEAGIPAARAAERAARAAEEHRRLRRIMWWIATATAAAGAVVVGLAAGGALPIVRVAAGAALVLTAAAMAASMRERVAHDAGPAALTLRKAIVIAAVTVFVVVCAVVWAPGTIAVVAALALAAWPLSASANAERAPPGERGEPDG